MNKLGNVERAKAMETSMLIDMYTVGYRTGCGFTLKEWLENKKRARNAYLKERNRLGDGKRTTS